MINFNQNLYKDQLNVSNHDTELYLSDKFKSDIPTPDELTGIEVRLSMIHILENGTAYIPLISRYSNLYIVVSTLDDKGTANFNLNIKGYEDVDDNEYLDFERTIYYWKKNEDTDKAPGQIHTLVSVIKSNEGIRNTGSVLSDLKKDTGYQALITELAKTVATGGVNLVQDAILEVTGILGKFLGNVSDLPLITQVLSYTDLNGDFKNVGKTSFTKGNKNVVLTEHLIVRDKSRESQAF